MRFAILALLIGCVDQPLGADPPSPRVIAAWDPLACGPPHRVVVEIGSAAASAPCDLGSVVIDVPSFGIYRIRAGDVELGELDVDQAVVALDVPP